MKYFKLKLFSVFVCIGGFTNAQTLYRTYYDYKKTHVHEEFYANSYGVKNGTYKEYSEYGGVLIQGTLKDDKKNGTWKKYDDKGRIVEIVNWKDDQMNGRYERMEEDGSGKFYRRYRSSYVTGTEDSVIYFFPDGSKQQLTVNSGICVKWYENKKKESEWTNKDGKEVDGSEISYFKDGNPNVTFVSGKKYTYYFDENDTESNGKIKRVEFDSAGYNYIYYYYQQLLVGIRKTNTLPENCHEWEFNSDRKIINIRVWANAGRNLSGMAWNVLDKKDWDPAIEKLGYNLYLLKPVIYNEDGSISKSFLEHRRQDSASVKYIIGELASKIIEQRRQDSLNTIANKRNQALAESINLKKYELSRQPVIIDSLYKIFSSMYCVAKESKFLVYNGKPVVTYSYPEGKHLYQKADTLCKAWSVEFQRNADADSKLLRGRNIILLLKKLDGITSKDADDLDKQLKKANSMDEIANVFGF